MTGRPEIRTARFYCPGCLARFSENVAGSETDPALITAGPERITARGPSCP